MVISDGWLSTIIFKTGHITYFEGIDTNHVEVGPLESSPMYSSTSSNMSIEQLDASGDQRQHVQLTPVPTQSSDAGDELSEQFKGNTFQET